MTIYGGPDIVTNGLVLHLDAGNSKSYPGSGTVWTDLSGNGNNGILTNGPTYSSDNKGSIIFDGVNDYILLGNVSQLQFERTDSFSCTCLARNNNTNAIALSIIGNSQTAPTYRGWSFNFYNRSNDKAQSICLGLYNNGTYNMVEVFTGVGSIIQGIWYHIAFTYNGTSLASGVKLYINGTERSTSFVYNNLTNTIKGTENLYIGSRGAVGQYMNGRIPSLQIYNRVLNANEILQNYNALKGRYSL